VEYLESVGDRYDFQIGTKERALLLAILGRYPVVPPAHQRLSRENVAAEAQELLDAALAEQREANRRKAVEFTKGRSLFRKSAGGWILSLSAEEIEWLLQVLNDVRVGSWLALGSPDGTAEILAAVNDETVTHLWAMEMSGQFISVLLGALGKD